MLAEFFTKLQEAAQARLVPSVVEIDGDDRYVLINGEKHELPPDRRAHRVDTLESLIEAAKFYATGMGEGDELAGTVWHDEKQVVVLVNDSDRRDRVTLPLTLSEQYRALVALGKQSFTQKQLVLWLKRTMRGAIDDGLLSAVRVLEFKRRNDGSGTVQHGKESLGRSVEAEVQGMAAIPETVTAFVAVYSTPGCEAKHPVVLSLDIDVDQQTFSLVPLADELTLAVQQAQRDLHAALDGELETPVYYGTP